MARDRHQPRAAEAARRLDAITRRPRWGAPGSRVTAGWDAARQRAVVRDFHAWFYDRAATTWQATTWLGVPTQQCPLDLWRLQELVTTVRPDLILETGTLHGGTALFLATVCEALRHGRVVSVDATVIPTRAQHPRIQYLTGDSVAPATLAAVRREVLVGETVLVLLDSDHTAAHVLAELRAYAPLVTVGSYCVVEDTNLGGRPVWPTFGPGPAAAVAQWLAETPGWVVDRTCERFGVTFHPGGWLRREA